MEVVERLTRVQVDPTSAVERAERLTLYSRLGPYDRDDLRHLLEDAPRQLFEYRAFLVPLSDLSLQRPAMLRYPRNDYGRGNYVGGWLAEAWRLPPSIVAAIRDHHRVELLDREQWTTAEVVVAANQLIHGTDLSSGAHKPQAVQILERTAAHGLTSEGWTALFGQLKGEADTISGLFAGA